MEESGWSPGTPRLIYRSSLFWLTITFTSFGLFAPRNGTVFAVVCWQHCVREMPPAPDGSRVDTSRIVVQFDALADPAERAFFNSVPTSSSLPDATVDRLIEVGRWLLRESPDYQTFLAHARTHAERWP